MASALIHRPGPFRAIISALSFVVMSFHANGQNVNFDILDGQKSIEIPFEFIHNFIVVDDRLEGMIPLKFIFDTGAENTILFHKKLGDALGMQYDLRIPIYGADLNTGMFALVTRSVDIEVAGMDPYSLDMLVLEEEYFDLSEIVGQPIHGILGGNFFRNTVVRIDYNKRRRTFYNHETFEIQGRKFQSASITIRNNKPYIDLPCVLLDRTELKLTLLIDTGAGLPLMLHNNTHPGLKLPENTILGQLGLGLGGYVLGYIGRIQSLQLIDTKFDYVITSFQDLSIISMEDYKRYRNGLIGNQMLSRFEVIIDYIDENLYLNPKSRIRRKFKMDLSGLVVFAHGPGLDQFIVQDIIEGSPAEEAGLREGDNILRLQGLSVSSYTLDKVTRVLQKKAGKKIRIVVERDDEKMKFKFRLRELI